MAALRYNKAFKSGIIIILIFFLVSVALITVPVISKIQYDKLVSNMKSIEATIVDIDLEPVMRAPDVQEIYITYEVDGVVYNRELKTDTKLSFAAGMGAHYSIGDKINIFYDPKNPAVIAAPRSVGVGYFVMAIGLAIFVLITVALFALLKNRQKFLVTQEEYERERREQKNSELAAKNGEKIRWQYFNTYIYMILALIPAVPAMIITTELRKGNFDIWNVVVEMVGAIPALLVIYGIFIGPFIILSIFNRLCFGKVLGVVNESKLFLKNHEISINDIKEIAYHPRLMSRGKTDCSFASFTVSSSDGDTECFDIIHFPLYGLRKIKKHNKNIKLKCDKYIWFLLLCPTVVFAVLGFLLG